MPSRNSRRRLNSKRNSSSDNRSKIKRQEDQARHQRAAFAAQQQQPFDSCLEEKSSSSLRELTRIAQHSPSTFSTEAVHRCGRLLSQIFDDAVGTFRMDALRAGRIWR